jgi:hypothetical protein
MKITEKQLIVLFDLAIWYAQLNMAWRGNGSPYSREAIEELVNEILNQQSSKLIEVE